MRRSILVLLAMVLPALACDNSSGNSTTAPTVPQTSQTFTGTVNVGGSSSNTTFIVAQTGEVDITVTSMGPPANIIMGINIGIPSAADGSCAAPVSGTQIQASTTPLAITEIPGTYCVKLYDVGFMTAPINYSITVAHP